MEDFILNKYYRFHDLLNEPNFEVMQWTGQGDSEGVKIYEGDIVEISDPSTWDCEAVILDVVTFDKGSYSLMGQQRPLNDYFYVKVKGNIHENPELLTECTRELSGKS